MTRHSLHSLQQLAARSAADSRRTRPSLATGTCFVENSPLLQQDVPTWLLFLTLPPSEVQAFRAASGDSKFQLSAYSSRGSFGGDWPDDIFATLSCPGHTVIAHLPPKCGDVGRGLEVFRLTGSALVMLASERRDDAFMFPASWKEMETSLTREEFRRMDAALRSHARASGTRGVLTVCEPAVRLTPDAVPPN
ncbi:MAG: hypothetical protein U1F53_20720 [Burkholderiaceae bacterium]